MLQVEGEQLEEAVLQEHLADLTVASEALSEGAPIAQLIESLNKVSDDRDGKHDCGQGRGDIRYHEHHIKLLQLIYLSIECIISMEEFSL